MEKNCTEIVRVLYRLLPVLEVITVNVRGMQKRKNVKTERKISMKKNSQNTTIKSVITVNVCGAQEGRCHNRTIPSERKKKSKLNN